MLDLNEVEKQIIKWYAECDDSDEVSELECQIETVNEQEFENRNYKMSR